MNRKKLRLLFIPILVTVIFICISISKSKVEGINRSDWVRKSYQYMENANSFINNMDNILTLYFSGITNSESYSTDYDLLKKQWKLLKADFEKFNEENPILPNTDSVSSQMNYEAIHSFYNEIDSLFNELDTINLSDSKYISYIYLAHQQNLVDYYATYMITYNIITEVYTEEQTS